MRQSHPETQHLPNPSSHRLIGPTFGRLAATSTNWTVSTTTTETRLAGTSAKLSYFRSFVGDRINSTAGTAPDQSKQVLTRDYTAHCEFAHTHSHKHTHTPAHKPCTLSTRVQRADGLRSEDAAHSDPMSCPMAHLHSRAWSISTAHDLSSLRLITDLTAQSQNRLSNEIDRKRERNTHTQKERERDGRMK
ncbi:unnamed protein product [Protopolystoma xenopodis]|uniref:Uncharacterized protein n=1 Tax=Protopolystoma xenopodis TaxID=117903 RepID=A0A448XA96_9PLAT|nr:unnamed protein product [Protopolystoma xenopodis]